jgi:L-rhamnose mutarotase
MERHALVVDVRPELRERYLELHSAVWPQVEATLRDCHVGNYSIFILENTLFAYYEYTGDDHDADMARIAEDEVTREWWTRTDPCQVAFGDTAAPGERWRDLTEVWHLP